MAKTVVEWNTDTAIAAVSMRLQAWSSQSGEVSRLDALKEFSQLARTFVNDEHVGYRELHKILREEYA